LATNFKWRAALTYLACFIFPFFGIAYGLLESCKVEPEKKRRGKICVALGVAATALVCVGAVAWLALGLKAGFGFLWPE
jgi:hypothetical protein